MLECWLWQTTWQRDGYFLFLKTLFTALHKPRPAGLDYDRGRRHNNACHNRTTKWQSKTFCSSERVKPRNAQPPHPFIFLPRLCRYRENPHSYGIGYLELVLTDSDPRRQCGPTTWRLTERSPSPWDHTARAEPWHRLEASLAPLPRSSWPVLAAGTESHLDLPTKYENEKSVLHLLWMTILDIIKYRLQLLLLYKYKVKTASEPSETAQFIYFMSFYITFIWWKWSIFAIKFNYVVL